MPIIVDSRVGLEQRLARGSVIRAKWAVTCEIGPNWIGAGRSFDFWIDDVELDRECFGHHLLAQAIVEHFGLPKSHENEATFGAATIERRGETLWIDYEWSRAVPYQSPAESAVDEAVFVLPTG